MSHLLGTQKQMFDQTNKVFEVFYQTKNNKTPRVKAPYGFIMDTNILAKFFALPDKEKQPRILQNSSADEKVRNHRKVRKVGEPTGLRRVFQNRLKNCHTH